MYNAISEDDPYINVIKFNTEINADLKKAIEPLLTRYEINYFYYVRYINNEVFIVCTDLDYLTQVVETKMFADLSPIFLDEIAKLKPLMSRKFIWTGKPPDKIHDVLFERNIWNGYTVYDSLEDGLEIWGVGTTRENADIIRFYLNESQVLRNFILYLKDQKSDLIDYRGSNRRAGSNFIVPQKKIMKAICVKDPLLSKKIKRYYLNDKDYLTHRELQCVIRMMNFQSSKQIAAELGVSARTVDKHSENIRARFKSHRIDLLLPMLLKSEILSHYFFNDLLKLTTV